MTFVTASAPHHIGFNLPHFVRNLIADAKMARARRAVFEQVYAELSAMTDRELADINISRLVIREIAISAAETAA